MAEELTVAEIGGQRFYSVHRHPSGWWMHETALDDWFDAPPVRLETRQIPGGHGSFEPADPLVDSRMFLFTGRHEASTPGWADRQVRTWAASLAVSRDLHVRVLRDGRWMRMLRAKVNGRLRVRELTPTITEFQIPIWAADPRKYGEDAPPIVLDATTEPAGGITFPIVEGSLDFGVEGIAAFPGVFRIHNPGTAEFYPNCAVTGPVDGFTITSESNVIEYAGAIPAGSELVLSPYLGGRAVLDGVDVSTNLLRADWVAVQPGETRGFLFTADAPGAGARLTVTYPNGAWW